MKKQFISIITLPIVLVVFIDVFYFITQCGFFYFADNGLAFFLSLTIIYALYGTLIGVFKRTKIPLVILTIIVCIFSILNGIKIFYTDEPIGFSDFFHITDMGNVLSLVNTTFSVMIIECWKHWLAAIIFSIVFIIIANKNDVEIKNKKFAKKIFIISIITMLVLFFPFNLTKNIILNNVFLVNNRKDYNRKVQKTTMHVDYGVIASMYEQMLENRIDKPLNYDESELENLLASINIPDKINNNKPNVILLFSESFWDVSQLNDVKFDKPVTSNFSKLKEEGKFINIVSPVYGGVSANTEFELLTGANTCYFTEGYIPYLQLINNKYNFQESIIKQFTMNNYNTKFLTANGDELFNCANVYSKLGIEETEYLESKVKEEDKKGLYVSDEYITTKIINDFENKEKGKTIFYIGQTMQAHMPYGIEKYKNYDIKIEESNYDKEVNDVLLSYSQGIYDADVQLGRLYDYIKTLEEPTVLVFLGDHLPYLKTVKGENAIEKLDFFNTNDNKLNTYRKYNTQALILANYDIDNFEDVNYLGYDLLFPYLIKNIGLEMSAYYNWLYTTKDSLPANNHYILVDNIGNLYNFEEMTEEMKKTYELKEKMQYKFFINNKK